MLCWAANLVEAYNKELQVGFKDRVMVLLRPSKGGGVEDVFKLTKGRSVNFFHVLPCIRPAPLKCELTNQR